MKKHVNKLLLIGLIFAATGIVANIICIIVSLFRDVLPWLELSHTMTYSLILQLVNFVFALLILGVIVFLSVNVLVRNRLNKPGGLTAVFLIVVAAMAIWDIVYLAWSYSGHVALIGSTDALVFDLIKAFIFRGRLLQLVGFILMILGAIGVLFKGKINRETLPITEEE